MKSRKLPLVLTVFGASLAFAFCGCSRKPADAADAPSVTPPKPKEAATQIQQVFANANTEVKAVADVASQAMRTADYEGAVESLAVIKRQANLTPEQGMAIHNSMVSLEAQLIAAMNAGDANAKRAYELLKKARRN